MLLFPTTLLSDPFPPSDLYLSPSSLFSHCVPSLPLALYFMSPPHPLIYHFVPLSSCCPLLCSNLSFCLSFCLPAPSSFPRHPSIFLIDEAEDVTLGSWLWKWAQVSHFALRPSDHELQWFLKDGHMCCMNLPELH